MPKLTFSSPVMAKEITVYAIAGDRGTLAESGKSGDGRDPVSYTHLTLPTNREV